MSNTTIALRSSGATGNVPNALSLAYGEFALNYADGIIYYRTDSNTVGSIFVVEPVGLNREIQFNDSGSFGSNSDFTYNKTTGVLSVSEIISNTTIRILNVANSAFSQANLAFDKANTGTSAIVYSNTAPSSPTVGLQWVNTDTGVKYDYTNDGDTFQWIELGPTSVAVPVIGYTTQVVLTGTTTDATEKEIFINAVSNNRITLSSNATSYYTIDVVARRTDVVGESASFFVKATAANNTGTVSDVGSIYEVVVARDDVGFSVDARANNTTKSINIYVTGVAGKTLNWKAVVTTLEV
jgi:hypothetical protein